MWYSKPILKRNTDTVWDVVVIGGGASGMMAAGRAASLSKKVLLLEKNTSLGKKLLITGGGRCNITNNKQNTREMLANYKGNDKFLFSAFSQFNVNDTLSFFEERGLLTKEENDGRMFPVTDSAQSVYDVLYTYMSKGGVTIQKGSIVSGIALDKGTSDVIITTKSGNTIYTKSCIVATGGISRPETGSTGDGYAWLKKLGHTIKENDMALVPLLISDPWIQRLAGVTLDNVKITIYQNKEKQNALKGKVLFTHKGVSGPTILNMSREVGDLLKYGDVVISLDLFPSIDAGSLRQRLQGLLVEESNKKLKNVLPLFMMSSLVPIILELAKVDGETFCHSVSTEDRITLTKTMKNIELHVKGLMGKEKAIISSGGVALTEVDFKTMRSKICPNIFLVGDVLDVDRPSGGYSLQLCWTTGFIAGSNA